MLAKYHGKGNPESPWVKLQLREYGEHLIQDGSDKRWWDYSALFKTRASRYRLFCNVTVTIFGQWAGNCEILNSFGLRTDVTATLLNLILSSGAILLPQRRIGHGRF